MHDHSKSDFEFQIARLTIYLRTPDSTTHHDKWQEYFSPFLRGLITDGDGLMATNRMRANRSSKMQGFSSKGKCGIFAHFPKNSHTL
jgi:hypothetical protein